MYTMFTDETNTQPSGDVKFFVYGGLIVPNHNMTCLHKKIEELRNRAGYESTDILKYHSRSKPIKASQDVFNNLKNEVINECIKAECKFVAIYILHNIIVNQKDEQRISWGANCIIKSFNEFLKNPTPNDYGIVIADRSQKSFNIFTDKFQNGLYYSNGNKYYPDRIIGYYISRSGSSHLVSATDIVIGSFRYCINNPANPDAAREQYKNIKAMQYSITEHPFEIKKQAYQNEYDNLKNRLKDLEIKKGINEFSL